MDLERAQKIREQFLAGVIPVDDLLLHIEPLLDQAATDRARQEEARRIVNGIERAIYTENEPRRSSLIAELLTAAVAFVRSATP